MKKIFFIFTLLFINFSLYAQEKPKFIDTPEELSRNLFKSIYESSFYIVPEQNKIYKQNEKVIGDEREVKRIWLGSRIGKLESRIKDLTLFFRPGEIRKIADVYLSPFTVKFDVREKMTVVVYKDNSTPLELGWRDDKSRAIWIRSNNKSDVQIFLPKIKNFNQSTRGLVLCQRTYKESNFSSKSTLEDIGYEIEAVKATFEGETESKLLTGASLNGKANLNIITTDNVSPARIDRDESFGKDPNVSLTYYPEDNDKREVSNDNNITMGLKFLYSMQYQSGKKKITDYTNYTWVKKEELSLPLFVSYKSKDEIKKIQLSEGNCYSIIFNAKIIDTTYLKDEFSR